MKQRAGIAQLVEQRTENPRARGSSPRPGIYQNLADSGVFEFTAIIYWRSRQTAERTELVKDYEKLCLAAARGWRVFLLADSMITNEYLGSIATTISAEM